MKRPMGRVVTPDRGYAWVVLAASLGCNYLSGVLVYLVGVIHVELLEKFQGDVTTTAWVGSLYSSLQMLGAPLASVLVHVHSCRLSVMVGSMLLCVGFVTSAFATSVQQLVFTYGLVAGTGLGLTCSPSFMIISFYFQKLHGLAAGLSICGLGMAVLTGPVMIQTFIDMYSLHGAFFVIAGLGLQGCVFGMLYRPTQHEGKGRPCQRQSTEQGITWKASGERSDAPVLMKDSSKYPSAQELNVLDEYRDPTLTIGGNAHTQDDTEEVFVSAQTSAMSSEKRAIHSVPSSHTDSAKIDDGEGKNTSPLLNHGENCDIELSADTRHTEDDSRGSAFPNRCLKMFRGTCCLMKNWAFLAYCSGIFFAALNISGVFLHLPEYVRTHGTQSTEAAALFVGSGVSSFVSRIGSGVLLTSTRINGLVLNMVLMALCGLASCLFPLYSSTYVGQMTFASFFGLAHGGFAVLFNILIIQLVDFNLLPAAYGLLIFVMGIGYVAGPPLSGLIVDHGGTYEHSFIFLGMAMLVSAAFSLLAKVIHKRQNRPQR